VATFRSPNNRPSFSLIRAPRRRAPEPADEPAPDPADEPAADAADERADRWWRESSYDLARGLEVREGDTIPGQLLDELVKQRKPR
jgi:hypothetical protein